MHTWITPKQRQTLLELILTQGIHYATDEQKVVARDGESELAWVMNFLGVSLHDQGLRLAALHMLELLEGFQGKQLATIGTAAVPLLSACILLSKGKYTGLMVRPKRKAYGTAKLVDGVIDYNEPVIVVDDSIGSGTNMLDCIQKLEAEGLRVEGGACLVRFGYNSGYARLQEQGYRAAAAFDLYKDLMPLMPDQTIYPAHPTKARFAQIPWASEALLEGLSPYVVVRQVIQHYLQHKQVSKPAKTINQPLDTQGGVWISLRSQDGLFTRYARQGFWHFPGETRLSACDDLVKAAYLVACELAQYDDALAYLERSGIGISALDRLQACRIGELDCKQYGVVLRSLETPWTMGGGLPNMDGIHDNAHLLQHVRFHNTPLRPKEPFAVYKHRVKKWLEPNISWSAGGASAEYRWDQDEQVAGEITQYLYDLVGLTIKQRKLPESPKPFFIPNDCYMVFVSVYAEGRNIACVGLPINQSLDLHQLVQQLPKDHRWCVLPSDQYHIKVSFLTEQSYLGTNEAIAKSKVVLGKETLMLQHEQDHALILADVVAQHAWRWNMLKQQLLIKAGIASKSQPLHWWRYQTQTWCCNEQGAYGYPDDFLIPNQLSYSDLCGKVKAYLQRLQHEDGSYSAVYSFGEHKLYQAQDVEVSAQLAGVLPENQSLLAFLQQQTLSYSAQSYYVRAIATKGDKQAIQRFVAQWLEQFNDWGRWYEDDQSTYLLVLLALLELAQQGLLTPQQEQTIKAWQPYFFHFIVHSTTEAHQPLAYLCAKQWQQWTKQAPTELGDLIEGLVKTQQKTGWFIAPSAAISKVAWTAQIVLLLQHDHTYNAERELAMAALSQVVLTKAMSDFMPEPSFCKGAVVSGFRQALSHTEHAALVLRVFQGESHEPA